MTTTHKERRPKCKHWGKVSNHRELAPLLSRKFRGLGTEMVTRRCESHRHLIARLRFRFVFVCHNKSPFKRLLNAADLRAWPLVFEMLYEVPNIRSSFAASEVELKFLD